MSQRDSNLIWIDLEMTGLDPETDRIIEIATIVTDSELNEVATGPVLAVQQSAETLAGMDQWNTNTHGKTGLTARVLASTTSEAEAEAQTLEFLRVHVAAGKSPMAGNSICQDRRFLVRYMPELANYFHYRNLDVSTVKELVNRWQPALAKGLKKEGTHRALDDIRDSIQELQFYRQRVFVESMRGN